MKRIVIICLAIAFLLISIVGVSCGLNGSGNGNEDNNTDNTAPVISGVTVSDPTGTTATISRTMDELADQVDALTNERDILNNQLQFLTNQNDNLDSQVSALVSGRDSLNIQLEILTSQNENLNSQVAAFVSDRDSLNAQLEVSTVENENLVIQVDTLHAQVAALQEQSNQSLRNFNSVSELEQWLAQDNTNTMQYIPIEFDCDDFAMMLQEHALADGYIMSSQYILYPEGTAHMLNLVVIGNAAYKVEPQTDVVTLWFYLDLE